MMTTKIAAIAQLCSTSNKLQNLYNIAHCAGWAKKHGAQMLFLPECFGFIGKSAKETLDNAEPIPSCGDGDDIGVHFVGGASTSTSANINTDKQWCQSLEDIIMKCSSSDLDYSSTSTNTNITTPTVKNHDDDDYLKNVNNENVSILEGLRVIARKSGLYISGGGMHEKGAPAKSQSGEETESRRERVYNTHIVLNDRGTMVAKYRKIHLFDVSIPSQGVNLCESDTTAPGSKLVVCDSPLGRLGLSTCYDLRFNEMFHELVETGGADILLVPSAFTVPTGKAHWHTLLKARAIENQCYVLAAAQYGEHNEKRKSYGHSIGIDPFGEVICDAGGYDTCSEGGKDASSLTQTPKIVLCEINDERIKSVRERMPIRKHRESYPFSW